MSILYEYGLELHEKALRKEGYSEGLSKGKEDEREREIISLIKYNNKLNTAVAVVRDQITNIFEVDKATADKYISEYWG